MEAKIQRPRVRIRVTEITNPSLFYAQLGSEDDLEAYDQFMAELSVSCEEKGAGATSLPPVRTFVAVKMLEATGQEKWRRAMVTRHLGDSEMECQLIDIGTVERVSCAKVCRQSPSQLCKIAAQALSCSLIDAAKLPGDDWWSKEAIEKFAGLVSNPLEVDVTVHNRIGTIWMLTVFTRQGAAGWTSIARVLADAGLGVFLPSEERGDPSGAALIVSQCEASAHPPSMGAGPPSLQGDEAGAGLCEQESLPSPVEHFGTASPLDPLINTNSNDDGEHVVQCDGDVEKAVTHLVRGKGTELHYSFKTVQDSHLDDFPEDVNDDDLAADSSQVESDSTEREKFLSDVAVGDEEKLGDRLSTPSTVRSPCFEDVRMKEGGRRAASQGDVTLEPELNKDNFCRAVGSKPSGKETDNTSSDGGTVGPRDGEESKLCSVGSPLRPFPVTVENSSDEDSDTWDESLLQPRGGMSPFPSRCEQSSGQANRKQACFDTFVSNRNGSSHCHGNSFQPKNTYYRYRRGNRNPPRPRYRSPPSFVQKQQNVQPAMQQPPFSSVHTQARGRGCPARFPKGYLRSQPQSLRLGKNQERMSNFHSPPSSNIGPAVSATASKNDFSTSRSFPDHNSSPTNAEPIPVSEFGSVAESDPMACSAKPGLEMTAETLKNEVEWNVWNIKQHLKKAWPCISNPEKFFVEVQKIVTGISAQKLYTYRSYCRVEPMDVILQGMVMFGVEHPDQMDDLLQCFQCVLSDVGAHHSLKPAFEEVAEELCQSVEPTGTQGRHSMFCSLLGKLWLLAVNQKGNSLLSVVGPVVCYFLDKWTKLIPEELPDPVLINSARCFTATCLEIGSLLDTTEREKLDDYFHKVKENILSDKLPRLAKETFLDIYVKRCVFVQNQEGKQLSVQPKPGPSDSEPCLRLKEQQQPLAGPQQPSYSQTSSRDHFQTGSQLHPQHESSHSFSSDHLKGMSPFSQQQQTSQPPSFDQVTTYQSMHCGFNPGQAQSRYNSAPSSQLMPQEVGQLQSGISQYWRPANPWVPCPPSPGHGPLGLSEHQAESGKDVMLQCPQSSLGQASFAHSPFGISPATPSQPQSRLRQPMVPEADVDQTMLTHAGQLSVGRSSYLQDQSGMGQRTFSQESQSGAGQTMFSQPQFDTYHMFPPPTQPGHDTFDRASDKLDRPDGGDASSAFLHQARSSQLSRDQLRPSQLRIGHTVSGTSLSDSPEYHHPGGNDQPSSPYVQQFAHHAMVPQSPTLTHTPLGITAVNDDPNPENCASRSIWSKPTLQVPGPRSHSATNKVMDTPMDVTRSSELGSFEFQHSSSTLSSQQPRATHMAYSGGNHQPKSSLQQSITTQRFVYNGGFSQPSLPDSLNNLPSPRVTQQGRPASFDASGSRQETVGWESVNREAPSQGLAPHPRFSPSHTQRQFPSDPARANSMLIPPAEASRYPWPSLSQQTKMDSPAMCPPVTSCPNATFEASAVGIQQTQSQLHYHHQHAQSTAPKAAPQSLNHFPAATVDPQLPGQSPATSIQRPNISYPRTKHILPSVPTNMAVEVPQCDSSAMLHGNVGIEHIPAPLQDHSSSSIVPDCARCGSKLHPTHACTHPSLINSYS